MSANMAKTKGISLNLMLRRPHGLAWSYMRAVRAPGFRTLGLRMLSSADASSSSVLLFGDSNTWGFDPVSHSRPDVGLLRIPHADRWTSLLRAQLPSSVDVAVDGLNARTTILHDPASPADGAYSCCGRDHLKVALHVHKPLDAVVLALGTNDLKAKFSMAPSDIAYNVRILVRDILKAEVGVGARRPAVLVLGLPRVHTTPLSTNWGFVEGTSDKAKRASALIKAMTLECGVEFLDIGAVAQISPIDGIHFDSAAQPLIAAAVASSLVNLLRIRSAT